MLLLLKVANCWKGLRGPHSGGFQARQMNHSRAGIKGNEQDAVFTGAPGCAT